MILPTILINIAAGDLTNLGQAMLFNAKSPAGFSQITMG